MTSSRAKVFAKLGISKPIVEPILTHIYDLEEQQIWEEDLFSSPHGQKWHTSFHASSFPGDDPKACGRKAIYEMMNVSTVEPLDASVRLMGEVGKAIEESIVWRFHRGGILISNTPDSKYQTTFVDEEHWLSCSPDAIIELPGKKIPHPVEVKGKDPNVLEDMESGKRSYDPLHRKQLLTQVGLTVENQQELWPDLEQCDSGTILYVARNRPGITHEYKFKYDANFMSEGRAKLLEWKDYYLKQLLPPRPKNWRWTEQPCKWCDYKKICKQDYKEEVDKLQESNTIEHTKQVRGNYDYEAVRKSVLERWGVDDE